MTRRPFSPRASVTRRLPPPLATLVVSGEARRLRVVAGITQVTMAAAFFVVPSTFGEWERGFNAPPPAKALGYLRVLNGLAWHERALSQPLDTDVAS